MRPTALVVACLCLSACRPTKADPRYEISDDAVRDASTGLTWMRKAAENMPLDGAERYCAEAGWRVPTVSELRTLVKQVRAWQALRGWPAIDQVAFPNTPTALFWAEPEGDNPKIKGWVVDFSDGTFNNLVQRGEGYRVRCVR